MTIKHHLSTTTLLEYASGSQSEALSAVVAAHLAVCHSCRQQVAFMNEIGGALLEEEKNSDEKIKHIATAEVLDKPEIAGLSSKQQQASELIYLIKSGDYSKIKWSFLAPGIQYVPFSVNDKKEYLRLMKFKPGRALPVHGHNGTELTLILQGAYHDDFGHYQAGDVSDYDGEVEHQPVIDSGVDCICLVGSEQPAKFKDSFSRLIQPLIGM